MISGTPEPFTLDARLGHDTFAVGDLPLSHVLLVEDSNYRWLILVPRRAGVVELIDLGDKDRAQLLDEITLASRAIKTITDCDKLNVAALGNVVPQLHVHVIGRKKGDPAWPKPVWGAVPPRPYKAETVAQLLTAFRDYLKIAPS